MNTRALIVSPDSEDMTDAEKKGMLLRQFAQVLYYFEDYAHLKEEHLVEHRRADHEQIDMLHAVSSRVLYEMRDDLAEVIPDGLYEIIAAVLDFPLLDQIGVLFDGQPPHPDHIPPEKAREAERLTVEWAERGKEEAIKAAQMVGSVGRAKA